MPRPIEYNHQGRKLRLAKPHERFILKPLGPNSIDKVIVDVVSVNEEQEEITFSNKDGEQTVSFDLWDKMVPVFVDHLG